MTATPLSILAIDDDPGDLELLRRHLEEIPAYAVTFIGCSRVEAARHALSQQAVDVIFLDYLLGAVTGLDILHTLRDDGDQRPIIVLTGKGDERIAAATMRAGADDYLVKEDLNPDTVYRSLRFVLTRHENERKRAALEEELRRLARFDELTGLCNRRYLFDRLTQEMLRAQRYGSPLSLMLVDLDHFKQINDTYGHIMGDTVLATVAGIIRETIRATDLSGRYGGEELCIVLTETKIDGASLVAERLRRRIAAECFPAASGGMFHVTCSIGLAQYHDTMKDVVAFLEVADHALYQAKGQGRNRVVQASVTPEVSPVAHATVQGSQDVARARRRPYRQGVADADY
jgi:diguanylate cyclase (GGDEF)-like protein